MTPTTRLRFVEREIETAAYGNYFVRVKVKILQQWWEEKESSRFEPSGEWRDVPLEEEA